MYIGLAEGKPVELASPTYRPFCKISHSTAFVSRVPEQALNL